MGQTEILDIDPDELTLGEVAEIEEIIGKPFSAAFAEGVTASAAVALVYVVQKRSNPNYTMDDARAVKIGSLNVSGVTADPTSGLPSVAPGKPATSA